MLFRSQDGETVPHCIQTRVLTKDEEAQTRPVAPEPTDATPVFSGQSLPAEEDGSLSEYRVVQRTLAAVSLASVAKTNPGRPYYFLMDRRTRDIMMGDIEKICKAYDVTNFHAVVFSDETKTKISTFGNSGLTFMANARLRLHDLFPHPQGIWIDTDTLVRENFSTMTQIAQRHYRDGNYVCGVLDGDWVPRKRAAAYINSGVLHMNFEALRTVKPSPVETAMFGVSPTDGLFDQTVVNNLRHGLLDGRWNVLMGDTMRRTWYISPDDWSATIDERVDTAYILHFTGDKVHMHNMHHKFSFYFFQALRELIDKAGVGLDSSSGGLQITDSWKRRLGL